MDRRCPSCVALTLATLSLLSCHRKVPRAEATPCTPWVLQASDHPIQVNLLNGHWQFEGSALLVGCRETLASLTLEERTRAVGAIVEFVKERHLGVLNRADGEFRSAAAASVNAAIRRPVVSDAWLAFSFAETDL